MGTAIGDLVATLGLDNSQWTSTLQQSGGELQTFSGQLPGAQSAVAQLGTTTEAASGAPRNMARSLSFLGKEMQHLGGDIAQNNEALGGAISTMGSATSAIGLASKGYKALSVASAAAGVAQTALAAISPIGWIGIAAAVGTAAVSYLYLKKGVKSAAEEMKAFEKLSGPERDRAEDKRAKELTKAYQSAKRQQGMDQAGGMFDRGVVGTVIDNKRLRESKTAMDDFNKAVGDRRQKEAIKETDSALDQLRAQANKIDKSPVEQFAEAMAKTGKNTREVASAIAEFEKNTRKLAVDKAKTEVGNDLLGAQKQHEQMGMTAGEKFADDERRKLAAAGMRGGALQAAANSFGAQMDKDTAAERLAGFEKQYAQAMDQTNERHQHRNALVAQMGPLMGKLGEKEREVLSKADEWDKADWAKKLQADVKGLTEGPLDSLIEKANEVNEGFAAGVITEQQRNTAMAAIKAKAEGKDRDQTKELPKALEYGTAAAWDQITKQMYNPEQKQNDQALVENTDKMATLLETIATNTANTLTIP